MPGTSELLFSFVGEKGIYWLLKGSGEDAPLFVRGTGTGLPKMHEGLHVRGGNRQEPGRAPCGNPAWAGTCSCPQSCQTFRGTGFYWEYKKQYVFMPLSGIINYTG
jgi:hypothetical protein